MSRLARGLAGLVRRTGLARVVPAGRQTADWRAPLDDALIRRLERLTISPRRTAAGGLGGEHRSRARASSTDFVDYRPYQPGDDFRQIDWNAYGRLSLLFVRLTEARERLPMHLMLDCSASMGSGSPPKLDYARQLAAVIGYVALARYDRLEVVRLSGVGSTMRPIRGRQRFGDLLAVLDGLAAGGSLDLDQQLAAFRPSGSPGQVILISDMLHPQGYARGLDTLAGAGLAPAVIQILSPEELQPELGGDVELYDVESAETVQVGLSADTLAVYQRRLTSWSEDVERFCYGRRTPYVRLTTDQPATEAALVALRRVGVLR